jgi:hypothetical protein
MTQLRQHYDAIDPLDNELARLRREKENREKMREIEKLRQELGWSN